MSVCPACGAHNRAQARFCRQCRSPLPPATSSTCPHCGVPLRSGARFCKRCGKPVTAPATGEERPTCPNCNRPVRDASRFCPFCGAQLAPSRPPATGARCPNCGASMRAGARFCSQCSHPLSGTPEPIPTPPPAGRFGTGDLLPTTVLVGRYVILEKIAQGGMGAIYRAQDRRLQGKLVAVKEMSESAIRPSERERVLACFQREAELLARLEHPNLVRVTDRFQKDERHFMVMELIEGQTLDRMLKGRSRPFPEEQVLDWARQLCDVLAYLHGQDPKIIYRDVKPGNVMIVGGTDVVKLIDFGIARFHKIGKRKDTIEFGTDGYAPPEQYGKSQTDERSDVYALGATLHQLLTLRDPVSKPFHFPPIHRLNPDVSPGVAAAIAKAVETPKDERHQSMEEMAIALLGEAPPKREEESAELDASSTPPISGKPLLAQTAMDFGEVPAGGASDRALTITLPVGETGKLSTDVPWLHVHPRTTSTTNDRATLTIDTGRLKPGWLQLQGGWLRRWAGWHTRCLVPTAQEQHGHVKVELGSGQSQRVPVSVTVVPRPWQVRGGWLVTVGAMLLEAAVAIGLLALLILQP